MNEAVPGKANLYVWVTVLVIIAALFTITGGLTAVMWTDAVQTAIMVFGAFILMIISFQEVTACLCSVLWRQISCRLLRL